MTNPGKYFSGEARGSSFLNVLGRLFLNPHPFVWLNSSNQKTYILDLFFFWKAWVVLAWEFCDCKSELASFTHGLLLHVVFLWITACQCASIKWKIGAKTSDVHKVRMPPALPWIMHIWLLIVLVIPPSECQLDHNSKHPLIQTCSIPLSNPEQYHLHTHTVPILWAFTRANTEYIIISEIMQPIVKRLLRLARTYTRASDAYHRSKVLPLLAATAPTIPHIVSENPKCSND